MTRIPKFQDNYNLKRVLSLKTKLCEVLLPTFADVPIVDLDTFFESIRKILPKVNEDALFDSVSYLVEERLSRERLESLCYLLAGNVNRLKRGKAVYFWKVQRFAEWVPAQVVRVVLEQNKRFEKGASVYFKILAGTSAAITVSKWWSTRKLGYFSRSLGFTKTLPENSNRISLYPWQGQPVDIVSFRLYLLIEPQYSKTEPGFSEIHIPSSFLAWNKEQIRYRFRMEEGYECPENYDKEFPCRQCWRGYLNCRSATHRFDYEFKYCPTCKLQEAVFDPEVSTQICVKCAKLKSSTHSL